LLAVSKTLGYLPVGPLVDFAEPAAGQVAPVLWVSGTEVALLAARRTAATPLRLVCARLINPNSGDIVRQLYGLTNVSAAQAEAAIVARWLVYQNAGLTAFRHIVHAWEAVPAVEGSQALARQALMAGQLGSACWQLAHAPSAAAMRALLGALMGYEPKLPTRLLPAALVKLFAMLEMAG
jgi:flagellar biosynthesis protein FlhF